MLYEFYFSPAIGCVDAENVLEILFASTFASSTLFSRTHAHRRPHLGPQIGIHVLCSRVVARLTLIEPGLCFFRLLLHLLLFLQLLADQEVLEGDFGNLRLLTLTCLLVPVQLLLLELVVIQSFVVSRLQKLEILVLVAEYQVGDDLLFPEGVLHFFLRLGSLRSRWLCAWAWVWDLLVSFG